MEAVTIRSSIGFVTVAVILLVAGTVAATYPLPPAERTVEVADQDKSVIIPRIDEKRQLGPYCIPRDILCVGPFEPNLEYDLGATGVRLQTEDVNATTGHNPGRKVVYGPYAFPTLLLGDDLRICYTGCPIADPAYARLHGNATVTFYLLGDEVWAYSVHEEQNVESLHPSEIPRTHCQYAQKPKTQC